ncbi:MAG: SGNH/GDSL hydrolase family protein [Bacteroidales bacterium]
MISRSRRDFFKHAGLGAAAVAGIQLIPGCSSEENPLRNLGNYFSDKEILLFQGDSITDAGRDKRLELPNQARSFGNGYALMIAARLLERLAAKGLTIYNRGISGNKVYQLAERWDKDCLDLHPGVLSILIGVNDYWHMRNGQYDGTTEIYEDDFRALLSRTRETLPDIRLIVCQPFILPGTTAVDESWLEPFSVYQEIAKKISREFKAIWVPFQEAFNAALQKAPASYWTADGVHPSMAGAQLMAETWLRAVAGSV